MSNQVLLGQALRSIVLKGSKETEERYERELAAAEADRKKAEAEFRAAGAVRIKEIKRRIGELSSEIRQAAPEQKRTLGEEIKKLNAEIESLKTPAASCCSSRCFRRRRWQNTALPFLLTGRDDWCLTPTNCAKVPSATKSAPAPIIFSNAPASLAGKLPVPPTSTTLC